MNSLLFHGVDYAIPLFVDEYSPELPVIVTVTSGSSGCGYEISADEVGEICYTPPPQEGTRLLKGPSKQYRPV